MKIKIISGGQTGADMGGLLAGKELGFETGGFVPKDFMTENGSEEKKLKKFGLKEINERGYLGYKKRTQMNIINSDFTLLFMEKTSPGSILTINICRQEDKICLLNPDKQDVKNILMKFSNKKEVVINVAGNRESVSPGIEQRVKEFLINVLKKAEGKK